MRVVVIGAGMGGLAAAANLVRRGHDVTVLERELVPGGRAGVFAEAGFHIDTGPTMITMPELLRDTFAAAGADIDRYVKIEPLDPMYRATFPDGSVLYARHDREHMSDEIRDFAGARDAAAFGEFCRWLDEIYAVVSPSFVHVNYDNTFKLARRWRSVTQMIRKGGFKRLDSQLASFFDDERLQRLFSFHSLQAGLAPHDAPAVFALRTYMDSIGGVFTAPGGMQAVATALARAIADAGATIRYATPVTRILRGGDGAVTGVEIGGSVRLAADAVVCNTDLPVAYRTLLGGVDAPRVARRGKYAPSCVVWVAGVRGEPPGDATTHNLHFGDQWKEAFKAVIERGVRMSDPSMLVTVQSLGDPLAAPTACATVHALEPVPNLDGRVNWARDGARLADDLKRRVGQLGYPTDVVVERSFDPLDWEAMGLERGTPWSLSHTVLQSGPFRPRNVDPRVPGLVFAGASTVPGSGVPLVLISGRLAAQRVEQYARETSIVRW
jgi:phytoene desaturase